MLTLVCYFSYVVSKWLFPKIHTVSLVILCVSPSLHVGLWLRKLTQCIPRRDIKIHLDFLGSDDSGTRRLQKLNPETIPSGIFSG